MATLSDAESRRMYSWWWDSHISPKNSKWLQENLTDMDMKVKSMIKLIEEDADSFARRAEMYYKKRPELMKLVEEFYRAYRALAERYDHATGALRQAQRTMAEVFPNQIPFALPDESPSGSSSTEVEPHTPEIPPSLRTPFDPNDMQKDASTPSTHFAIKGNGAYSDDNDSLAGKKGLQQLNEIFSSGEGATFPKFAESKVRKGLNFQEEEANMSEHGIRNGGAFQKAKKLQEEISKLYSENENLKMQVRSESDNASKAESESQRLKEVHSKLQSERQEALLQFQQSLRRISNLEAEIEIFRKLNAKMLIKISRLETSEEKCLLLEKENQSLHLEVGSLEQKTNEQQEELLHKQKELEELKISIQDEHLRCIHAEAALESLENLYSQSQEQLRISALEIQNGIQTLKDMEKGKEALEEDIRQVKEENDYLKKELKQKQEELEELKISIQNERMRSVQAEATIQSLEKCHAQSQEESKVLLLDIQSKVQMLKDLELRKQFLEEEVSKIKEEIRKLNEQNVSSQLMIQNLQDEILSLKESHRKLENEVEFHAEGKKALQEELHCLKEVVDDLQQRQKCLTDQLEAVGLNEESLQASVKELQDGNLELKGMCKQHKDENVLLLEKLANMDQIYERNAVLENSLSDANAELEGLKDKIKVLEESCEALHGKNSTLVSEKSDLVFKLESVTENMEKQLENVAFLENSLSDAIADLEGLRGRLKNLEESYQSLHDDNSNLQVERTALLSQVELLGYSLEDLKKKYEELHEKHSYLEKEKESAHSELTKLQDVLKLEKKEYEAFMQSSNTRLSILDEQISLLREDGKCREEEFKNEQLKLLATQTEIFILQRCLHDLKDSNLTLSKEFQKMEQHAFERQEKEGALLEHIGRLRRGMRMVLKALNIDEDCSFLDESEELYWRFILNKIKEIQNSIRVAEDEKHGLHFEKSVYITLLQQLGHCMGDLRSEKHALDEDSRMRTKELLLMQTEKHDLLETSEQLKHDLEAGSQREIMLEEELKILGKQLYDLKEANYISQTENCKLLEENQLLSNKLSKLSEEKIMLDREHCATLSEAATMDCRSMIFEQLSSERVKDMKILNDYLNSSYEINSKLAKKLKETAEKMAMVEAENFQLKNLALKLEECKGRLTILSVDSSMNQNINEEMNRQIEQLNQQMENINNLLVQKDNELSEEDLKSQDLKNQNSKLSSKIEDIKVELDETKATNYGLEQKIFSLSEDMVHKDSKLALILEANKTLGEELQSLHKENGDLRTNEEKWASILQNEVKCFEGEVAALCIDSQIANVHALVFEEKVQELMRVCETLEVNNMVERETLNEEISSRNAHIGKLNEKLDDLEEKNKEMKTEINEYLPIISSLGDSISSLENFILPFKKSHLSNHHEMQDVPLIRTAPDGDGNQKSEDLRGNLPEAILELQKLLAKVETLREVLAESGSHLILDKFDDYEGKNTAMQQDEEVAGTRKVLDLRVSDGKMSGDKDGLMMKDIQLDHVSSSFKYDNAETDDQMLELWETAERDYHKKVQKDPLVVNDHDRDYPRVEVVADEKSEYPSSELVAEKELGVDKLEVPKKVKGFHQDWNNKVLEKLTSDAGRLAVLQTSVQELKNKMDNSEHSNLPKSFEYDTVKMQLLDAEETILQLVDTNRKLIKKAEGCSTSSNIDVEEADETKNQRKKQISDRARRGSDKIGRLELELHKLNYILLKLEEEFESRKLKAAERKSRVLLRDYLYGRRDSRRKRGHLCGCMRPKTTSD